MRAFSDEIEARLAIDRTLNTMDLAAQKRALEWAASRLMGYPILFRGEPVEVVTVGKPKDIA